MVVSRFSIHGKKLLKLGVPGRDAPGQLRNDQMLYLMLYLKIIFEFFPAIFSHLNLSKPENCWVFSFLPPMFFPKKKRQNPRPGACNKQTTTARLRPTNGGSFRFSVRKELSDEPLLHLESGGRSRRFATAEVGRSWDPAVVNGRCGA